MHPSISINIEMKVNIVTQKNKIFYEKKFLLSQSTFSMTVIKKPSSIDFYLHNTFKM